MKQSGHFIPLTHEGILLPADDPELFETNLQIANQLVREMSHDGSRKPVILLLLPVGSREPVAA